MPWDRLQCPLYVCLHGCTQLCYSKLRFTYPAYFAQTKGTCYSDTDFAQNPENMDPSPETQNIFSDTAPTLLPLLALSAQGNTHAGAVLAQVRHSTPELAHGSLHMPLLAQPAPTPHFLLTPRDSAWIESNSNTVSQIEQYSRADTCPAVSALYQFPQVPTSPRTCLFPQPRGLWTLLTASCRLSSAALDTPKAVDEPRSQFNPHQRHRLPQGCLSIKTKRIYELLYTH